MGFLRFIAAIFVLVGVGLLLYCNYTTKDREAMVEVTKFCVPLIIVGLVLTLLTQSLTIVPTGYTGVRSTFGQISEETVQNGFNWKIPFVQKIEVVNNKQQDITFEDKIWSETANRTAVYYENVTVTYQINPDKSSWVYANISNYKDELVSTGIVSSAVKSASKELRDIDATSRTKIEPLAMNRLQEALNEKYSKDVVVINKVVINGADFEDSYNKAIAKKQKAQLEAEEQDILNKKNIAKAEAEAEVKLKNAEAESKANKMLEKSLTDNVIKSQYIEKWDGKMPSVVTSKDGNIMIGMDK
nr:MAG TPA: High frequency of lysogenization C protein [Caudoviricetes sp.]